MRIATRSPCSAKRTLVLRPIIPAPITTGMSPLAPLIIRPSLTRRTLVFDQNVTQRVIASGLASITSSAAFRTTTGGPRGLAPRARAVRRAGRRANYRCWRLPHEPARSPCSVLTRCSQMTPLPV